LFSSLFLRPPQSFTLFPYTPLFRSAALPAVNVIGSHSTNAALQAAKEAGCPIIVQVSNGGAHFYAGKGLSNAGEKAAVVGAIAADRKSTRLNSSHVKISYAVFCLKK